MRASIEEDPGWGVPAASESQKRAKMWGRSVRQKTPAGKKMITQNRSDRSKTVTKKPGKSKANESSQGRAQSWWRPSRF